MEARLSGCVVREQGIQDREKEKLASKWQQGIEHLDRLQAKTETGLTHFFIRLPYTINFEKDVRGGRDKFLIKHLPQGYRGRHRDLTN